jgi:hypothetical protein
LAHEDREDEAAFVQSLKEAIDARPIRMIVLDTEAHMSGAANSNAAHEIKQVGLLAKRLSDQFKCAVGVIAHPAKHDKGSGSARGSQVNTEMFGTAWHVERQGEKADLLTRLTITKGRDDGDGTEFLFKGRFVDVTLPADSEGPQETYRSIVLGMASAQETKRYKTRKSSVKRSARDETTLQILASIAELGGSDVNRECSLSFAWVMERRRTEWLNEPSAIFDQVAARPWTPEEQGDWKKERRNYRQRFDDAKKRARKFGDAAIAGVSKTDDEYRVFPQVAKRVVERSDDDGDDE